MPCDDAAVRDDRLRWDRKHADKTHDGEADAFALEAIALARAAWPAGAPALDVACGAGRHLEALAAAGFRAQGIDVSPVGLARARERVAARGLHADLIAADLDDFPLPAGRYALILVVDYLARGRFTDLASALAPGGFLVVSGFVEGHPKQRAAFCHFRGELRRAFASLAIVRDEEIEGRARFVARKSLSSSVTIARP